MPKNMTHEVLIHMPDSWRSTPFRTLISLAMLVALAAGLTLAPAPSLAAEDGGLDTGQLASLKKHWAQVRSTFKGPYTINYCTCTNGERAPVADKDLNVRADPCALVYGAGELFCSAYRTDLAQEMGEKYGLWVANIFANEVYTWDAQQDHDKIAKGFILERYYMNTNPDKPLTVFKSTGGISGAEFEARYAPQFFARYYAMPGWKDFTNYLVQYELQRRFFLGGDESAIHQVRNISSAIRNSYEDFKPLRDLIHNQMSPGLVPIIEDFQRSHPQAGQQQRFEQLKDALRRLTSVDVGSLARYGQGVASPMVQTLLKQALAAPAGISRAGALGKLVAACRSAVAPGNIAPEQAVRLVNLAVAANGVLTAEALAMTQEKSTGKSRHTVRETLELMEALADGGYGAGLISSREHAEAQRIFGELLARESLTVGDFSRGLDRAGRLVEWAQSTIRGEFGDVLGAWVAVFPEVARFPDDVIRSSPLFVYARLTNALTGDVQEAMGMSHMILGQRMSGGVRPLNPGLAYGTFEFFKEGRAYSRDTILALESTSEKLDPVAGIITRDEGNAVSHVQLLARALGVPNAVFRGEAWNRLHGLDGSTMFYAISPKGRVVLKLEAQMDSEDRTILEEYRRNEKRRGEDGSGRRTSVLSIDANRLDLSVDEPLPLSEVRRKDSGVFCGPKAAFLGELRHFFPDNVARAVVLPFGVYAENFGKAEVTAPPDAGVRVPKNMPLKIYVRGVYDTYFGEMLTDPSLSQEDLANWIKPRLDVIRHSIESIRLDPGFVRELRKSLEKAGLIDASGNSPTGIFVRSDTNVEDLPNFNGAGLNLTLFNIRTFDGVLEGIKKVWASPFTFRSFSWRQSVISNPELVYPSLVLMEAVPSQKSGVLVTADVTTGDRNAMTVATAEGVGGTVDGSPAETLLVEEGAVRLLSQFKSPYRRLLSRDGGSYMAPSTGNEWVLSGKELVAVTKAARTIDEKFEPATSSDGRRLPWDIEFGFVDGKLSLFQARPFVGNSDIRNLPALAALDDDLTKRENTPFSLKETLSWQ